MQIQNLVSYNTHYYHGMVPSYVVPSEMLSTSKFLAFSVLTTIYMMQFSMNSNFAHENKYLNFILTEFVGEAPNLTLPSPARLSV